MSVPVLYDYYRSSACYRVRIALGLKQIDHEVVRVDLLEGGQNNPDYRARNPQGLIPLLQVGKLSLTQSLAIIDWLDERYPHPALMPADPDGRAKVRAMALIVACDIHPLNNLRVLKYLSRPLEQPQEARDAWYRHWVTLGFEALEALARESAGRFLFGDEPTLADCCLVPQMYNARRFEVPLEAFPTLVAVDARSAALPAFADAHPDRVGCA